MEILKKACVKRDRINFDDLKPGDYIIDQFSIQQSKHGKRLRVDLSAHNVYLLLPERFATCMDQAAIDELNSATRVMAYRGKDNNFHNRSEFFSIFTTKIFLRKCFNSPTYDISFYTSECVVG